MATAYGGPESRRPRRFWRSLAFRLAAVLVGLAPLATAEGILWSAGLGRPDLADDPFVGFSAVWPLFVPDATGENFEVPPAHFKFFRPERFAAVKPPGEFRAFVLGDSTVQGSPFATETAFSSWMEIGLNALDPSKRWRVINCGGTSYASYRLAPILREALAHGPDLFIIYVGHNEFLEDRTYGPLKAMPRAAARPLELASRLRTFQAARAGFSALFGKAEAPEPPAMLGPEVEALLDYEGGLDDYHRDDDWRDAVVAHYEFNLRRMIRTAREAGIPVVLCNPVSNLDTPPFKSQPRDGLSEAEARRFEALQEEARDLYATDLEAAAERLEEARRIDDRHAGLHYALAKCLQALNRPEDARWEFVRARDEDVCPLRAPSALSAAVREVAAETGVPLFDADALFRSRSRQGIPGGDWLVDHVHPSIEGHRLMADALIGVLADEGIARPDPSRQPDRARKDRDHLGALDATYFLLGQKRLGNLRLWAEGRGNIARKATTPAGPMSGQGG